MEQVKVAAVVPPSFRCEEEHRNAKQAVEFIKEAAAQGVSLVCFPEGYPGPTNGPIGDKRGLGAPPLELVRAAAKEHRVYVACGQMEESGVLPDTYYLCHRLISPQGQVLATYRRCQPTPPAANGHLYNGRFHVLPGNELSVTRTEIGNLGMIICSEINIPELARVEMLMGAEVLIVPFGGTVGAANIERRDERGRLVVETSAQISKSLVVARAVENTMFVVGATNYWGPGAKWGACIASPDGVLAEREGPGIAYAALDLARLRFVRGTSWREPDFAAGRIGGRVVLSPGMNRNRRPDLYGKITEPQPDAFDFFYWKQDPAKWRDTFDPPGARQP